MSATPSCSATMRGSGSCRPNRTLARWGAMPRKLKVFRTPIGFHDAYVAASSRKAALAAWGADADLFARGVAEEVTDPTLTAAPLARPGEVVRVVRGTMAEHLAALPRCRRRGLPEARRRAARRRRRLERHRPNRRPRGRAATRWTSRRPRWRRPSAGIWRRGARSNGVRRTCNANAVISSASTTAALPTSSRRATPRRRTIVARWPTGARAEGSVQACRMHARHVGCPTCRHVAE